MQIRKLLPYITQGVITGLAAGAIAALFIWGNPYENKLAVTIKEAPYKDTFTTHSPQHDAEGAPGLFLPDSRGRTQVFSYANAVRLAAPSVVNIHTTKIVQQRTRPMFEDPLLQRFFGPQPGIRKRRQTSLGSGVIISDEGYIITNHHVIEGADEILIALYDGRSSQAQLVAYDAETDLAVLKINLDDVQGITFGHSDKLQVGDITLAIGNPFGVGQTVTQGIISATGRNQLGLSAFENFLQTDAAINPGNSGGALINPYGELIGINTAIFSRSGGSEGIGFAIPVNMVKDVTTQLIQNGAVTRSWLGIEIQALTPSLAESFGLNKNQHGAIVTRILRNGPAHKAGLTTGDIITHIDETAINNLKQAMKLIAAKTPNSKIQLDILRDKNDIRLTAIVSQRPRMASQHR